MIGERRCRARLMEIKGKSVHTCHGRSLGTDSKKHGTIRLPRGEHWMDQAALSFAADFPPATYEDWLKAVEPILKGAPFDKKLVHRSHDGLTIRPLYTRHDWPTDSNPSGFPGFAPFTRGSHVLGLGQPWEIAQAYATPDPAQLNRELRTDLDRGVAAIFLRLDDAGRSGCDADGTLSGPTGRAGTMLYDADGFDRALDGIDLTRVPVRLIAGGQFLPAAALLAALWHRRGLDPAAVRGGFNADPLGALAADGRLPQSPEAALVDAADLAVLTDRHFPKMTAIGVDTGAYHRSGASESQDLAYAMATGLAYLRAMTATGLSLDRAARQIAFTLAVGCDLFQAIAKLRAARRLWARIVTAAGGSANAAAMRLHGRSADVMMTRYDPWVNMLRCTVACFAAGVAGADGMVVQSFDTMLGQPDTLGRRVARNTQVALQEEAHLTQVIDAAGGSWYVECLTDALGRAAWREFQEVEAAGGMAQALGSGMVKGRIDTVHATRLKAVSTRREPITGISEFPKLGEELPHRPCGDLADLIRTEATRLADVRAARSGLGQTAPIDRTVEFTPNGRCAIVFDEARNGATLQHLAEMLAGTATAVTALPMRRLAEPFEALRDASEAWRVHHGSRPRIFLANLGPIAEHTARATFAKNFFEAGGIEAFGRGGFETAEACADAFRVSGAAMAVVCSSDQRYGSMVSTVAPALRQAGCAFVFLAGHPGDRRAAYTGAGVDEFIHIGCNVLEILRATLARMGVIEE